MISLFTFAIQSDILIAYWPEDDSVKKLSKCPFKLFTLMELVLLKTKLLFLQIQNNIIEDDF